jgi:outer membrane protein OmpA-like peptidoglycan-associated protein
MKSLVQKITILLLCIALLGGLSGCKTTNNKTDGALIGGAVGGAIGGVIGNKKGSTAAGAIIGAAIGGSAGILIGNYMDKQAEEIEEDLEGAEVERVGEGILITFDSGLMFDFDSYALRSTTKQNLQELSDVLKKYEDTNILIEGHTDAKGADSYNQNLSEKRADAVSDYLAAMGVNSRRITEKGYGEEQPIASNDSEAGRQQNRRVEVAIYANEELKKAAKRGDLE